MNIVVQNRRTKDLSTKINRYKLSELQKRELKRLLSKELTYIPDDCFYDLLVIEPIMEKDVIVLPGVPLDCHDTETLFLQLNYLRYRMCQVRQKLLKNFTWRKANILELLNLNSRQLTIRSRITSGNMGLVLAMAKYANYPGIEFCDLISEGSMALLRATEKFNCARGFKFSTYACRAILKSFSRVAKRYYKYRNVFSTQWDNYIEKNDHVEKLRVNIHNDRVEEVCKIFHENLAHLTDTEIYVVKKRFSLDNAVDSSKLTLKQVGNMLGLSKERIRQIQNKALKKLRVAAMENMDNIS